MCFRNCQPSTREGRSGLAISIEALHGLWKAIDSKQFWRPLSNRAKELQSQENPHKLLMFMVDYEGKAGAWNLPFAEKLDDTWEAHIPVRSPKLIDFCDRDLKDWIQDVYPDLPSDLTHKPSVTVKAILEHSEGGVPELALDAICDRCGYDWYEESEKWLTL